MKSAETNENYASHNDVEIENLESDDTHVVLDQDSINALIGDLQKEGKDNFDYDDDSSVAENFLNFAEKRMDELANLETEEKEIETDSGPTSVKTTESTTEVSSEQPKPSSETQNDGIFSDIPDTYLSKEYLHLMPSWAKDAYMDGTHSELEEGGRRISPSERSQRLHDIVAHSEGPATTIRKTPVEGEGIVDCTVGDVADDYNVPFEFVVDAMIAYGVPIPIGMNSGIRDSMTTEEIHRLLKLITSFDPQDLSDRYSDRSIEELSHDYDLTPATIVQVCEEEALYLCNGEQTRLSVVREDRVLDIILNNGKRGQLYPPLLEGLE